MHKIQTYILALAFEATEDAAREGRGGASGVRDCFLLTGICGESGDRYGGVSMMCFCGEAATLAASFCPYTKTYGENFIRSSRYNNSIIRSRDLLEKLSYSQNYLIIDIC